MICTNCGNKATFSNMTVLDGRTNRRYTCSTCKHKFSSVEIPLEDYQGLNKLLEEWQIRYRTLRKKLDKGKGRW